MRRVIAVGSCLFALATASCAAIFGFERLSEGPLSDDGGSNTTTDGATGTEAGVDPRCAVTGYPDPPVGARGGNREVIGAIRRLDFGILVDGGVPAPAGYNLDLTCTTSPATSSCRVKAGSTFAATDVAGGVDNAGFPLFATLSRYSTTFDTDAINQGVVDGHYGATVRVAGWNGLPDDDEVVVDVFPAFGARGGAADGGIAFVRSDVWKIDARFQFLSGIDGSTVVAQKAYVVGGQLVAKFGALTLEIGANTDPKPFEVTLDHAVLTGRLNDDDAGSSFLEGGLVSGRWATARFLDQVRKIYVKNGNGIIGATVCDEPDAGRVLYDRVKAFACVGPDIRADAKDNQDLPCDALSATAKIEGYRVDTIGEWTTFPAIPERCVDSGIPTGDDCN